MRNDRIVYIFKDTAGLVHFFDADYNFYKITGLNTIVYDSLMDQKKYLLPTQTGFFFYDNLIDDPLLPPALLKKDLKNISFKLAEWLNEDECYREFDGVLYYLNNKSKIIKKLGVLPADFNWWGFVTNGIFVYYQQGRLSFFKDGMAIKGINIAAPVLNLIKAAAENNYTYHGENRSFFILHNNLYQLSLQNDSIISVAIGKNLQLESSEFVTAKKDMVNDNYIVGTLTSGLLIIKPAGFETMITRKNNFLGYSLYDVISLGGGNFLCNYKKFNVYDSSSSSLLPVEILSRSLFKYNDDRILFMDKNNALFIADKDFTNIKKLAATSEFDIRYVESFDHTIWTSFNKTLWQVLPDATVKNIKNFNEDILYLFEYDASHLWVLTVKGMLEYNIIDNSISAKPLFPNLQIRSIYRAKDNSIWLGTYGNGLYKYYEKKIVALPLDSKEVLSNAHNFYEDAKGFFWIPTNNGLIQCLKSDLDAYVKDSTLVPYYYRYSNSDGLITNEFNGGSNSPYGIDEKGTLVYPSINGVAFFSPLKMHPVTASGNITISSAMLDDKLIPVSEKITIPSGFSRLTINIGLSFFGSEENLVLEYNVEGLNTEWYQVPANRQIVLNRLPTGEYKLLIRKRNGFGVNNYQYEQFDFTVQPHFYETRWFNIAMVGVIIGIVGLFFYLKNRSVIKGKKTLEKQVRQRTTELDNMVLQLNTTMEELYSSEQKLFDSNKVKDKAISIILHDIKAPVRYLSMAAGSMHSSVFNLSRNEMKTLSASFAESAQNVNMFVEELLEWLLIERKEFSASYSNFLIYDLMKEIGDLYKGVAFANNNTITIVPVSKNINVTADYKILQLIIRNLLDNALKHTSNGQITLSAEQPGDNNTHITIKDTGKGISKAELESIKNDTLNTDIKGTSGLGYGLVKSFLKLINGTLSIESKQGKGTEVTIVFPLLSNDI